MARIQNGEKLLVKALDLVKALKHFYASSTNI